MASKIALVGLVILVVGLIIGIIGAASPVSGAFEPLLSTTFNVDGNGYQSKNLNMSQGQTIQLSVSIANNTLFNFYIMNQTNYYAFYGCAPACHAAPNVKLRPRSSTEPQRTLCECHCKSFVHLHHNIYSSSGR